MKLYGVTTYDNNPYGTLTPQYQSRWERRGLPIHWYYPDRRNWGRHRKEYEEYLLELAHARPNWDMKYEMLCLSELFLEEEIGLVTSFLETIYPNGMRVYSSIEPSTRQSVARSDRSYDKWNGVEKWRKKESGLPFDIHGVYDLHYMLFKEPDEIELWSEGPNALFMGSYTNTSTNVTMDLTESSLDALLCRDNYKHKNTETII